MEKLQDEVLRLTQQAADKVDRVYSTLETLCICFPGRVSGTETLEHALNYLVDYGRRSMPAEMCSEELVTSVPCWVRGDWKNETCGINIIPNPDSWPEPFPLNRQIRVLANGLSVGTGPEGVRADIVIVDSWDKLNQLGSDGQVQGKIVLFDYKHFEDYGSVSAFRRYGAIRAASHGAVGVLIRTLAPDNSVSGVHTGSQEPPKTGISTVPAACVAVEDAELLRRLACRGHRLEATLCLPCYQLPDRNSRNIIFEIKGTELPHEIVVLGGHTDSWDCHKDGCQGAHDDGQGVVIALEIIRLLHDGGWQPRRTIRAVLFVDEEVCQSGANAYAEQHADEASSIVAAIETDLGVGPVCGFGYSGSDAAREQLRRLLAPIGNVLQRGHQVDGRWSGHGVDISPLIDRFGVPGLLLRHEDSWWNNEYFHMHHTNADTIDHVDIKLLKVNFQVLLSAVWMLANCDETLSR